MDKLLSFVINLAKLRNSGNPKLPRNELDFVAFVVGKDDLGGLRGFAPVGGDVFAILEDVGDAGADSGDLFVIIIGHGGFLDVKRNDDARCDLNWIATIGGGDWLIEVGRADIGKVR